MDSSGLDVEFAVVGPAIAVRATLIRLFMRNWHNAPKGGPTARVLFVEKLEGLEFPAKSIYPLRPGVVAADLHPFDEDKPLPDFPTFGDCLDDGLIYIRPQVQPSVLLRFAVERPTCGQILEYVNFILDLAIVTVGGAVELDRYDGEVREQTKISPDGPTKLVMDDGSVVIAGQVLNATYPHQLQPAT